MKIILADKTELVVNSINKNYSPRNSYEESSEVEISLDILLTGDTSYSVEQLVELFSSSNTSSIKLVTSSTTDPVIFEGFTTLESINERYDSSGKQTNIRLKK